MNELIVWDYNESVTWMKPRIQSWVDIWDEIRPELIKAREELSSQGNRTDLTSGHLSRSWESYCEDIGISKRHANRLLADKKALVTKFTGNIENYTPETVITAVKIVLGDIDLDPASHIIAQEIVQAKDFFTQEDNGLGREWYGRIFLNPPYQYPLIESFVDKLVEEYQSGNVSAAILLTNNNTDTEWFHKAAVSCKVLGFTKGRINFYTKDNAKTQPTNGQALFYYGNNEDKFIQEFKTNLLVVKILNP